LVVSSQVASKLPPGRRERAAQRELDSIGRYGRVFVASAPLSAGKRCRKSGCLEISRVTACSIAGSGWVTPISITASRGDGRDSTRPGGVGEFAISAVAVVLREVVKEL